MIVRGSGVGEKDGCFRRGGIIAAAEGLLWPRRDLCCRRGTIAATEELLLPRRDYCFLVRERKMRAFR